MRTLVLLTLLAASAARAEDIGSTSASADATAQAPSAPASSVAAPAPKEEGSIFYDGNHFGVMVDAGIPGGAGAAVVVRPWQLLRVHAGMSWNYFGFGVKGGATLVPFHWGVVPTLGLEAGHFFNSDASRVTNDATLKEILKNVSYTFVTGDIGLEFGSQNRFVFFIRGGMSYITGPVKNVARAFQAGGNTNVTSAADATLSYFGPTAKLGFILYLF